MSILEKLRLLSEWSPVLSFLQQLSREDDPHAKSIIVFDAAEWLADKTDTSWDDELVELLADIVASEEGEKLVRWIVAQIEASDDE